MNPSFILHNVAVAIERDYPNAALQLAALVPEVRKMETFCDEMVAECQEESMIARDFKRQEELRECGVIPFPRRERQSRGWDAVGAEVVEFREKSHEELVDVLEKAWRILGND